MINHDKSVMVSCKKDKKNASFAPLVLVFPEATSQIVLYRAMPVKDMSSTMSSLPTMKSDYTNCDFWDRLWISAKANGWTIKEIYAICQQIAPPNFSGQMVHLVQPTNAPLNSNGYAHQYIELRKAVQPIVGSSGVQTNVTTIKQRPNESFVAFVAKAHKEFVATHGGPDLDSEIIKLLL